MARLSWLDSLLFGIRQVYYEVASVVTQAPERPAIKLLGDVTVADDPVNKMTVVTFNAQGSTVDSVTCVAPIQNTGTSVNPIIEMTGSINDSQHGSRGGGSLHAVAVASGAAGFMSGADKAKLDGIPTSIASQAFVLDSSSIPSGLPNAIPGRALVSTLGLVGSSGVTPLSVTHQNVTGGTRRALDLKLSVSDNSGHGAAGDGIELGASMPDASGAERQVGRLRNQWTSPTALTPRAAWILSVLTTDGEHDALTVADTGDVTLNVPAGVARTLACEGTAASLTFGPAQRSSTGSNPGVPLTIAAGQGQNVGGGTNNDGAALTLASGGPGSGGSGGASGALILKTGSTERVRVLGDGSLISLTATAVSATGAVQSDTGFDTATGVALSFGASNATALSLNSSTGVTTHKKAGTAARTDTHDSTGANSIVWTGTATSVIVKPDQRGSTGANPGVPLTIQAGQGQNVGGGTNNAGGDITVRSGGPGTGGSGGANGTLSLGAGSFDILTCDGGNLFLDAQGTIYLGTNYCQGMNLLSSGVPLTIDADVQVNGLFVFAVPPDLPAHTVAQLTGGSPNPDPAAFPNGIVIVTDDATGCGLAVSRGGAWKRVTNIAQTVA